MAYNTPLQPHRPSRPLSRGEFGASSFAIVFIILFIATLLPACKPGNLQTETPSKYFDIKGYFEADTARLTKLNPLITKTATHNGVTETKKLHIDNWGAELNLFIQSDINKPAWRESYNVDSGATGLIYRAKTLDLKTQLIVINKQGDKIKWVMLYNSSKNYLYETNEKLSYFPDSLYIIQKYQKVRLLGANNYLIKGYLR
ncbi:MAG: hypothetical protein V4619_06560 [Bacteroidota bacterium]